MSLAQDCVGTLDVVPLFAGATRKLPLPEEISLFSRFPAPFFSPADGCLPTQRSGLSSVLPDISDLSYSVLMSALLLVPEGEWFVSIVSSDV